MNKSARLRKKIINMCSILVLHKGIQEQKLIINPAHHGTESICYRTINLFCLSNG